MLNTWCLQRGRSCIVLLLGRGLRNARRTQIKVIVRLAKGAAECCELLYPTISFPFPLQKDGKQGCGPGAATSRGKWPCPQGTQPQATHNLERSPQVLYHVEDPHVQPLGVCVTHFDTFIGCVVCSH